MEGGCGYPKQFLKDVYPSMVLFNFAKWFQKGRLSNNF
jgi:hypothetical protein